MNLGQNTAYPQVFLSPSSQRLEKFPTAFLHILSQFFTHQPSYHPTLHCLDTEISHDCEDINCNTSTLSQFYYFFNKYKLLLQFHIHFIPYTLLITALWCSLSPHYNHRNLLLATCCHFISTKWEGHFQEFQ